MKHLSNTNQNSNKLINVPTPVDAGDAVNKSYTDTGLDSKVNGDGVRTITVSEAEPVAPQEGDLWVNESISDSDESFDMGHIAVTATGQYMIPLTFIPAFMEFEVQYEISLANTNTTPAKGSGYYKADGNVSFSHFMAVRSGTSKFLGGVTSCPFGISLVGSDNSEVIGLNGSVTILSNGFRMNVTTKGGSGTYHVIWKARR